MRILLSSDTNYKRFMEIGEVEVFKEGESSTSPDIVILNDSKFLFSLQAEKNPRSLEFYTYDEELDNKEKMFMLEVLSGKYGDPKLVLGINRGFHVMNDVFGGNFYLPVEPNEFFLHKLVFEEPKSEVKWGEFQKVNSFHSQYVDRIGKRNPINLNPMYINLIAVCQKTYAPEIVEWRIQNMPSTTFLGVQFNPEYFTTSKFKLFFDIALSI